MIKAAAPKKYSNHPEKKRLLPLLTPDNSIVLILQKKQAAARAYMALNHDYMCAQKRAKYVLAEPKPDVKDMYVKEIQSQLLADAESRSQLSDSFP